MYVREKREGEGAGEEKGEGARTGSRSQRTGRGTGQKVRNNVSSCSFNRSRSSKRLTLESDGVKVIENDFLGLLVDLLLFPQNDISFPLDRTILQLASGQDIRDDLY